MRGSALKCCMGRTFFQSSYVKHLTLSTARTVTIVPMETHVAMSALFASDYMTGGVSTKFGDLSSTSFQDFFLAMRSAQKNSLIPTFDGSNDTSWCYSVRFQQYDWV
jgi:hypothetical protein